MGQKFSTTLPLTIRSMIIQSALFIVARWEIFDLTTQNPVSTQQFPRINEVGILGRCKKTLNLLERWQGDTSRWFRNVAITNWGWESIHSIILNGFNRFLYIQTVVGLGISDPWTVAMEFGHDFFRANRDEEGRCTKKRNAPLPLAGD